MKKKIIITVIVVLFVAGAAAGGVFAYKSYNDSKLVADVTAVSNLNMGYWGDETQSYGTVTNDISQDIYPESDQIITQVYVQEGQTVAIGDKLMEYDITEKQLELEMKKLDIQGIDNDITLAQRELTELKNTTPIVDTPEVVTPVTPATETETETQTETEVSEKTGSAYNYISKTAKAYDGDGSEDDPFHFLCTQSSYVYGSYLNYLKEKSYTAVFEIRDNNKKDGTLISSWTVNGAAMDSVEDDSKWSVLDRQEVEETTETEADSETEATVTDTQDETSTEQTGYTADELKKAISDKEKELKDLDLDKRSAELEQKQLEKECEGGIVYATINGTVKTVGDPNELPTDGSAFLSVSGSEGLYVTGSISEMLLNQVKEGQVITATSWDSGMTFQATVTEISPYPLDGSNYNGSGNPNASYYPFTAYIEDSTGLTNGEGVQLSMTTVDSSISTTDTICIEKAYVREEDGKSYVLKADENNRLVKQYITTGKVMYGQAVMITGGLSLEDRIAFPYGKTAKEGVKVSDSDGSMEG